MEFNPLTVVGTLLGGLILAGLLGWIRKPRLVALVPKLFSHSRISDNGQIVEVWFMNRGFKNEEQIEAIFNPHLRYELIGSNNPSVTIEQGKLLIPRIGTGDDCAVLLQVEGGKFSQDDIVSCLSKETKGSIASKLEEVPITSVQRIGLLAFVLVFGALIAFAFKGIDWYFSSKNSHVVIPEITNPSVLQDWKVAEHYRGNAVWKHIEKNEITISVADLERFKGKASVLVTLKNGTSDALTVTFRISASANQDSINYSDKVLSGKLLMPNESVNHTLMAAVDASDADPKVLVEVFIETADGASLQARRLLSIE